MNDSQQDKLASIMMQESSSLVVNTSNARTVKNQISCGFVDGILQKVRDTQLLEKKPSTSSSFNNNKKGIDTNTRMEDDIIEID